VERLKRDGQIKVDYPDMSGVLPFMRHNSQQPPFNNPGVRRALLWALDQQKCMQAIAPDPSMYDVPVGMFTPNSPMASDTAMQPLTAPCDLGKATRRLE
jgi:peptide/nickel transport system substrate-binding protein